MLKGNIQFFCTVYEYFAHYHTIPRLRPGPLKKTFWSVLVLVTLSMLLFHTYTVFQAFLSYSVTVDMKIQTERELIFPAITFCNVNPVKKSALLQSRDTSRELADLLLDSQEIQTSVDPDLGVQVQDGDQAETGGVLRRRKRAVIGRCAS